MTGAPQPGVRESLRELGADALALARVRIELLALEKERKEPKKP